MKLVGLTGDIGAGKSTVDALLAARGAVIVDADLLYREVVEPEVLPALVERFGPSVRTASGKLDRPALAKVVFHDDAARKDLNAITGPFIVRAIAAAVAEHAGSDKVVIVDVALMRKKEQYGVELMVVVTAPVEVRVTRLVEQRGMSEEDARARVAAQQAEYGDRAAVADVVIDNAGSRADLEKQVDALWHRLTA